MSVIKENVAEIHALTTAIYFEYEIPTFKIRVKNYYKNKKTIKINRLF
jgi:hypothetical protein